MTKFTRKKSTGHLIIAIICIGIGLILTFWTISSGVPDDKYLPNSIKEEYNKISLKDKQEALIPSSLIIGSIFFIPSLFELRNWRKEINNETPNNTGVSK